MANVRMHYVAGNRDLAKASLPDTGSTLKIVQRMRLEDSQLDGVARKMETKSEHCMLLALPNGSEHEEMPPNMRVPQTTAAQRAVELSNLWGAYAPPAPAVAAAAAEAEARKSRGGALETRLELQKYA